MSISISRCHTSGSIAGVGSADMIGGLIGWLGDAQVEDCYSTMDITCDNGMVGGLIGWQDQVTFGVTGFLVERCYAQGDIEGGADFLGGLIAWMANGAVSECFAEGNILGLGNVGGFCGWLDGGTIEDCYARGSVVGHHEVGGFAGYQWGGIIRRCYSTGLITCTGTTFSNFFVTFEGYVNCNWVALWADAHDGPGIHASDGTAGAYIFTSFDPTVPGYIICRGCFTFDTAALVGRPIVAANLWCRGIPMPPPMHFDATTLHIVVGVHSDPPVVADYQLILPQVASCGEITSALWDDNGWNAIALNALGLATINPLGITKFNLRDSLDISNIAPLGTNEYWTSALPLGLDPSFLEVEHEADRGGFIGARDPATICLDCYFDYQAAGLTYDPVATPKTTAEMKDLTHNIFSGWDFLAVWAVVAGCNE